MVAEHEVVKEGPDVEGDVDSIPEETFSGTSSADCGHQATGGMAVSDVAGATARPKTRRGISVGQQAPLDVERGRH